MIYLTWYDFLYLVRFKNSSLLLMEIDEIIKLS